MLCKQYASGKINVSFIYYSLIFYMILRLKIKHLTVIKYNMVIDIKMINNMKITYSVILSVKN